MIESEIKEKALASIPEVDAGVLSYSVRVPFKFAMDGSRTYGRVEFVGYQVECVREAGQPWTVASIDPVRALE